MLKNRNKIFIFIILVFIASCQKVEILDPIVFDYNQFSKVSINVEKKNISCKCILLCMYL